MIPTRERAVAIVACCINLTSKYMSSYNAKQPWGPTEGLSVQVRP